MKSIGIYKITSPSGRVYIGQTVDAHNRFIKYRLGLCKQQRFLYNSFQKHGFENHTIEMIMPLKYADIDVLNSLEIAYMKYFNCIAPNGLNLIEGGGVKKPSQETLQRMRDAKLGKKALPSTIEKIRINSTGRTHSEESKIKMSRLKIEAGMPDSHKDSIRVSNILRSIPVVQLSKKGEFIAKYDSIRKAEASTGIGNATISAVCKKKYGAKTAKGFNFEYANNYQP